MLGWLLDALHAARLDVPSAASLLEAGASPLLQVTLALLVAWGTVVVGGPRAIAWLTQHCREPNVSASPRLNALHRAKSGTPTMGGVLIVAAILLAVVAVGVVGDPASPVTCAAVLLTLGLTALGACDDLVKLSGRGRGLRASRKLAGQTLVVVPVVWLLWHAHSTSSGALAGHEPAVWLPNSSWLYWTLATLLIVGFSNAVNLTDGLDGLAGGCLLPAAAALGATAWVAADPQLAAQWGCTHLPHSGPVLPWAAAMLGAVGGFLRFNRHPARVFMGDTGSLPLGGLLGLMAVATGQLWLALVVGGVFVVEAASVALQVTVFRLTGRRPLRCAPLHHHFQFLGWPERRIVPRFWLASVLCAAIGLPLMLSPTRTSDGSVLTHTSRTATSVPVASIATPQTATQGQRGTNQPTYSRVQPLVHRVARVGTPDRTKNNFVP